MNLYQEFIAHSRYSRWLPDHKRRETWEEVVDRYLHFLSENTKEKFSVSLKKVLPELRDSIISLKSMPSMRALMMAGPALERCNVGAYNCSYLPVDSLRSFDETMYILMCGTGVGFSVERQYVSQLPVISESFEDTTTTIIVEDSRSGWAKGFRELLSLLYSGRVPKWDLTKLRPAGARLKTTGGRSSGPDPLNELFLFCTSLFQKASGRRLTSLECHDLMCKIGEVVVVGGVRRSALISLSNLSDDRMRDAKAGQWWLENSQRALSNNSVCYTERPDLTVFMREWLALYQSRSGERGIFNRQASISQAAKNGRRKIDVDFGTNPCQPGFALVLTPEGLVPFDDIDVGSTIWSGQQWTKVTNKVATGVKQVYEYVTNAGRFIGTENHRIVQDGVKLEVKDATSIDVSTGPIPDYDGLDKQDIVDGWVLGDGSIHKASNNLVYLCLGNNDDVFHDYLSEYILEDRRRAFKHGWKVKTTIHHSELPKTFERRVPARFKEGYPKRVIGFLQGLYAANGSVCGNRVTLKAASRRLIEDVQDMLSSVGISSYITTNKPTSILFDNGEYDCKQSYDLNISKDRFKFRDLIGFIHSYKQDRLNETGKLSNKVKTSFEIVEIRDLGKHEVFDITVEADEHTYWTSGVLVSNCSEIILRPYQFCNLTEVVVRSDDDLKSLSEKVRLATILGTLQSTLTDFKYLRAIWKKNTEEERLLGVSLTGIMDNPDLVLNKDWMEELKNVAIKTNKDWSDRLGINPSVAITCVKPSGTVSQLVDSASGIHPRWSQYYIRTVRGDNKDPITNLLKDSGVPNEPDVMSPGHVTVFSFPQKAPSGAMTRKDLSALSHLDVWKKFQDHYCEHKPSITVNVKDKEWLQVQSWVWDNFDQVSGIAFLPYDEHSYKQAPYQEITKEKYNELTEKFPTKIDWSRLPDYEKEDETTGLQDLACASGVCEVVDLT